MGAIGESFDTMQARAWWQSCTESPFFIPATMLRTWMNFWRTPTHQRLVYFSESILERWRNNARNADADVSTFSLFASWIQMVSRATGQNGNSRTNIIVM